MNIHKNIYGLKIIIKKHKTITFRMQYIDSNAKSRHTRVINHNEERNSMVDNESQ